MIGNVKRNWMSYCEMMREGVAGRSKSCRREQHLRRERERKKEGGEMRGFSGLEGQSDNQRLAG